MLRDSKRTAFSLFEASVGIVILGVIGLICSTMLLDVSKNIAYTQAKNDTALTIALLKIENLLEHAIVPSIKDSRGNPLQHATSELSFYRIDEGMLFGGGDKTARPTLQGDTLLPRVSIEVSHYQDKSLYFSPLRGWRKGMMIYLVSPMHTDFTPYTITDIRGDMLVLDTPIAFAPRLALPVQSHSLALRQDSLWLDGAPIALHVLSFEATPLYFSQGMILELTLCKKTLGKPHCEKSGIWLDSVVESL